MHIGRRQTFELESSLEVQESLALAIRREAIGQTGGHSDQVVLLRSQK